MLNVATPTTRAQSSAGSLRREGRLAALDGLRLCAALLVVLYHFVGTAKSHIWVHHNAEEFGLLYKFATYGYLGVQLFFMISGFVICMSSWDRSLRDFFISRTVRLFPMYWVAIVISTIVVRLNKPLADATTVIHGPKTLSDLLVNFTMAQDAFGVPSVDAVYWTLWAELRFYLLFAIVVAMGLTYKRVLAFCMLWMVAGIFTYGMTDNPWVQLIIQPAYMPYFVAGVLLYLVHRFGSTPLLWGLVGVCLLIAQHQVLLDTRHFNQFLPADMQWIFSAALLCAFFAAVSAVALGWLSWARWKWLTVAGAMTYPLYLLHQDIGVITIRTLKGKVAAWPLLFAAIAGLLVLAYLCHRLIERPFAPRLKQMLRASFDFNPRPRTIPAQRTAPPQETVPPAPPAAVAERRAGDEQVVEV
ncbi:acyltransferase family protein [Dactylosporangium sp. CA-092794]|uniref:acyltransferase family protein n=1 Tax=Dactylosporangium sp. CA-092794 TaxID=3239929 RepID=UPI003D8E04A5